MAPTSEDIVKMTDNKWLRNSFVWVIIMVAMLVLFFTFVSRPNADTEIPISKVLQDVRDGKVSQIKAREENSTITVCYGDCKTGTVNTSQMPTGTDVYELLRNAGITDQQRAGLIVDVEKAPQWGSYIGILGFLLPTLVLVAAFIFMMRQAQGSNNQALSFGKSRARLFTGNKPTITFADVAGVDEAKQELTEVVEFLKYPDKFNALGARIPRGVLLVGPPGTGKTMLSRAVAGEAGVPFFSISGSEFVEMFVGVGASRVRDLFDQAKKNSPCIIFVDEIDAVGRHRGAGLGGGNDEREQTLNQILVEMDGFDSETNIVIIAATNRPDILDPALLRPGRFDRKVVVDRPDRRGREAILQVHARGKPLAPDVDLNVIAAQTPGMVGADLENLINEAAILAARRNKRMISMDEMVESIERVMAGPARRSRILTPEDRKIVAYHEAGHALVFENLEFADKVGKITIVSRGQALGYVMRLPEADNTLKSR